MTNRQQILVYTKIDDPEFEQALESGKPVVWAMRFKLFEVKKKSSGFFQINHFPYTRTSYAVDAKPDYAKASPNFLSFIVDAEKHLFDAKN